MATVLHHSPLLHPLCNEAGMTIRFGQIRRRQAKLYCLCCGHKLWIFESSVFYYDRKDIEIKCNFCDVSQKINLSGWFRTPEEAVKHIDFATTDPKLSLKNV